MGIVVKPKENKDWKTITKEKLHFDVEQCPCCKTGKMITVLSFPACRRGRDAHGPPPMDDEKIK